MPQNMLLKASLLSLLLAGPAYGADNAGPEEVVAGEPNGAQAEEIVPAAEVVAAPVKKATPKPPAEVQAFLDRVFKALSKSSNETFAFQSWAAAGKPTEEGFGLKKFSGVNSEKVIQRVMDVDHYVGNLDKVLQCRSVPDSRFVAPAAVRFYQQVDLSVLGEIHHELVLVDAGMHEGYRVAYWYMLEKETTALGTDGGARSAYNVGAWFARADAIGYALSSAPVKDDVNYLQWKALTDGANVAASSVVEANIDGMKAWASR